MKLLKLKARHFRSFEELDLDLSDSGLISITGPNGAGKSSIFGAIEWALYGHRRGTDVQRVAPDGTFDEVCRVELEFEVNGRVLRVIRVDRKDAWLIDVASGTEMARHLKPTSREVAVQLGLNQEMFRGTFYARQKEVQALTSKDLSSRKDQLERLLGIEHLRVAADFAAQDAREQKSLVESLREEAPNVRSLQAELEQGKKEAQSAAPAIQRLETQVVELSKKLKVVYERIDALTKQIAEHGARQLVAERGVAELAPEQTILDGLLRRVESARAAELELRELEPLVSRADDVGTRERDMDLRRRNHEQVERLRAQERRVLEELATAKGLLAKLGEAPEGDPAGKLNLAQQRLNEIGRQLRDASIARRDAVERSREAHQQLNRATKAAVVEKELAALAQSEAQLERVRERGRALRGEKAELKAQLAHDVKHRNALQGAGDTETGVCPTCSRPLEGSLGDLIAEFETSIAARKDRLAGLTLEMDQVTASEKQLKVAADKVPQLRAQLEALGAPGDRDALAVEATKVATAEKKAIQTEEELEKDYRALEKQIPALKATADWAVATAKKRTAIQERMSGAKQQAATYAEQLQQFGRNGYDPAAHAKLKADHEQIQKAIRRSTILRESAGAKQPLEKQIASQEQKVKELTEKVQVLRKRAAEVAPEEKAHGNAVAERDLLSEQLDQRRQRLDTARQEVSREAQAMSAAQTKLEEAQRFLKRVGREREELELRGAVASALEDYREHASQRSRPLLEEEASNLLKRVTSAAYPVVRLTENYLLEIADGSEFHSSKRFSGGEQDLAALCLRLALARTLAHQRGVEHTFVILDEVFGSQDVDRRRILMEQLRELAKSEFQQIFVISHIDDVTDHCSTHISVTREHGISRVAGRAR